MNNLGTLLYETGYRTAARTAYTEAVARHPDDPMSLVNLANVLRENGELAAAREHYERALQAEPDHPEAHQGLTYVLAEIGDEEGARLHRHAGFQNRPVVTLPYRGERPPVAVLQFVATECGNVATRNFLDDRLFQTSVVFPEFYDPAAKLPPHQLVFNAIGDADLSPRALVAAQSLLAFTSAPVINPPAAVLATGRAENSQRLCGLPGVVMPRTVTVPRGLLASSDVRNTLARHGFNFPFLLRTPGFHTGRHFVVVDQAEGLAAALAQLPGKDLMVIQYLDARGADGKVRKYRVMLIDGQIYPLHLAISSQWKVHYFSAEMADRAEHRAEDAEFLENMPGVLGSGAMNALAIIQTLLGLDYGGIDFGLNAAGEVLLFEANATMVVNPPEPDVRWAYRRAAVERIYTAVRRMLLHRSGVTGR